MQVRGIEENGDHLAGTGELAWETPHKDADNIFRKKMLEVSQKNKFGIPEFLGNMEPRRGNK